MVKISVIVPIYNVASFIEHCVDTLMGQTLKEEVEFIFVNDATPDKSIEILCRIIERYPGRKSQIKILEHEHNKGLPTARNTGLAHASGEYVFHCDSDDFVEADMLERLYSEAHNKDADIVWCDYYVSYENSERYMAQPCYPTSEQALKGMLCGRMKYNVWNKLVRRSLYTDNDISFPAGNAMGEDMTMIMLFAFAKNVVYIPVAYYHYVQWNTGAMTREYTPKHIASLRYNADRVVKFLKQHYPNGWEVDIHAFLLLVKWYFLISDKRSQYRLWREWFPEANAYIWKDKHVSFRIKCVEWCASKGLFGLVWLHYWIVIRFFYSIAYK